MMLKKWNAPITQTHALRHLANQNGKQAGISAEDRAANLGHSVGMNTATYLKREATNTRLAAIDAQNTRTLPLEGAVAVLKRVGVNDKTVTLISEIYGIKIEKIMLLLRKIK
jgi:malonyl CoA-acyl carrier protein transacylase